MAILLASTLPADAAEIWASVRTMLGAEMDSVVGAIQRRILNRRVVLMFIRDPSRRAKDSPKFNLMLPG